MHPKEMIRPIFEFNKTSCETIFKNMNMLQNQAESMVNLCIDQAVGVSDESKKAARECVLMYRKGHEDFQKLVNDNLRKIESLLNLKSK